MYFEDHHGETLFYVSIVVLIYILKNIHFIFAGGYHILIFLMDPLSMSYGHVIMFHVTDLECMVNSHVQFLFMMSMSMLNLSMINS